MDPFSAEELELNYLGLSCSRNHHGEGCEAAAASTASNRVAGSGEQSGTRWKKTDSGTRWVDYLISYLEELQPLLTKFQNMMVNELPLGLRVGLDGIKIELQKFQQQTLHMCKSRSRLHLLIHCRILVESIQEITHTIAQWLSLIPVPARTFHSKELSSKTKELARTMLQA
jgi:hypothetical protein